MKADVLLQRKLWEPIGASGEFEAGLCHVEFAGDHSFWEEVASLFPIGVQGGEDGDEDYADTGFRVDSRLGL